MDGPECDVEARDRGPTMYIFSPSVAREVRRGGASFGTKERSKRLSIHIYYN